VTNVPFSEQLRAALAAARYPEVDRLLRSRLTAVRTLEEARSFGELISWANLTVRAARAHDAAQLAGIQRSRLYLGRPVPAEPTLDLNG
jgi:hypothetical protein